jgi:hypothetical protein
MDSEFFEYCNTNGISISGVSYTQTGIAQSFTCAATYAFSPTATMPSGQLVSEFLVAIFSPTKLINVDVNTNNIVATFQFNNSADFSTNVWPDIIHSSDLHAAGVTRSYAYSLVTSA